MITNAVSRRSFILASVVPIGALLAAPMSIHAQSTGRIYRLGMLVVLDPKGAGWVKKVYSERLAELGWHEGRNLSIDLQHAKQAEEIRKLAALLVATKPDVLVCTGPYAIHSLKDATQTIPIVFGAIADPVGRGLVASVARPGGNITGTSHYVGAGLDGKFVQLLKELMPQARRFVYLVNPSNPLYVNRPVSKVAEDLAAVGRELKITVQIIEARTVAEIPAAFEAAGRGRAEALIVPNDSMFDIGRDTILGLATSRRLPAIHGHRGRVEAGGLISYGTDFRAVFRRSAEYVDKVLRGANPGELPIDQPTKFEMVINMKTAKNLGLTIPPSLLLRADQIIE